MEHKQRTSQLSLQGRSIGVDLEDDEMLLLRTLQGRDRPVTGAAVALGSGEGHMRQQFKRALGLEPRPL